MLRTALGVATAAGCAAAAGAPRFKHTLKLNNGVEMPQVALGTWQYNDATAEDAIKLGFAAGFVHIDTAENYNNQKGVGKALKASGKARSEYFLTTKTVPPSCSGYAACKAQTAKDIAGDLSDLGLPYVDLLLHHGPKASGRKSCTAADCEANRGSWAAYEDAYKAGKAKAIGLSNYCKSCIDCLIGNATVAPTVNQIELHVGMGTDPAGLVSYTEKNNMIVQAYSPLGNGKLVSDSKLTTIGKSYDKTASQVALKWIVDHKFAVATKADNAAYLAQDIDMFSWSLAAKDMTTLDADKSHPNNPSWACTA